MQRQSYDSIFFGLTLALVGAGLFILGSASLGLSAQQFGYPYYYLLHQILFGLIPGIILLWITFHIPYQRWKRYALPLLLVAIGLMFLVFTGLGVSHGGARRWIAFGPVSFQPSELLKFAYIVYLAAWFESKSKQIGSFVMGLLPFFIMSGFIASFLILQPDIGTLGVLMITAVLLFAISGGTWKQIILMMVLGFVLLGILAIIEPYRFARVMVFLNPSHDPQGIGYQINQAFIAIGSGGIWGRGFALSRQKFSYLPEPMGDSIFAIAAEELGFIGSMGIVILFVALFFRGMRVVRTAPDRFGILLGTGLLLLLITQAFINIIAISGLGPLTGIPLSFISYGGSALALHLAEIGIILNISKHRS